MSKKYYFAEYSDSARYSGPYNSIEEARKGAEEDGLKTYWIGEEDFYHIKIDGFTVLELISQDLDCEAYEDAGEDWWFQMDNPDEMGDEISNLIHEYLEKKGISTSVKIITNQKEYRKQQ